MEAVFQEIKHFYRSAMVDVWCLPEHKFHPVKSGKFDIMFGPTVGHRHKIALPLTEVTALYNHQFERWEYIYGGGWNTRKTIPLQPWHVWY
tara:strand:- start:161 stop:433 length:273 start_codon:yes stop_codon:yes gene_type:complete